jgi:hypothetical protein
LNLEGRALTKAVGICNGRDSNGYALLKPYTLTGDPVWLARARAFAMYAIEQNVNGHSLWEGDLGLASFMPVAWQTTFPYWMSIDDGSIATSQHITLQVESAP